MPPEPQAGEGKSKCWQQQFPSAVAKVTLNKSLYRTSIVAIDNLVKNPSCFLIIPSLTIAATFLRQGAVLAIPIPLKP